MFVCSLHDPPLHLCQTEGPPQPVTQRSPRLPTRDPCRPEAAPGGGHGQAVSPPPAGLLEHLDSRVRHGVFVHSLRLPPAPLGVDIELLLLPLKQLPQHLLQSRVRYNALRTENTDCKYSIFISVLPTHPSSLRRSAANSSVGNNSFRLKREASSFSYKFVYDFNFVFYT